MTWREQVADELRRRQHPELWTDADEIRRLKESLDSAAEQADRAEREHRDARDALRREIANLRDELRAAADELRLAAAALEAAGMVASGEGCRQYAGLLICQLEGGP